MKLLNRTSKVGKDGVTFESSQERGSDSISIQLPFSELMRIPISATVLERERNIKEQFNSFKFQNENEKIEALMRLTAIARIECEFTNIAHTIYGSQVELLINLVGTPQGSTISNADVIFKQAKELFPEIHSERDLDTWIKYLISNNLLKIENNKIDITQVGADFLKFLVDARLAYPRKG